MNTTLTDPKLNTYIQGQWFEISTSDEDQEWDDFLFQTTEGNHLQSSQWGRVKKGLGWKAERMVLIDQGKILAGAQLLIRYFIPWVGVCYITRGPILAPGSDLPIELLIKTILSHCREMKIALLVIQPPPNGQNIVTVLSNQGFHVDTLELAPTATILVDIRPSEEQLLSRMKRQTRQNIRRSAKEGIQSWIGGVDDIHRFYELHQMTSQRQKFLPYKEEYFSALWDAFGQLDQICLVFCEYEHELVSGLLLIAFGETVCAKLLGWSGAYPEKRPNDALFWAAIRWAQSHGYSWFDFEGISRKGAEAYLETGELPEEYHHSPDFLKYGFGGQVTLFPEAYSIMLNPAIRMILGNMNLTVGDQSMSSKIVDWLRKR
jgi:peptidoglycan pentaglycine glycine transferase (the first glycine)